MDASPCLGIGKFARLGIQVLSDLRPLDRWLDDRAV
jgi:hypothetical protein